MALVIAYLDDEPDLCEIFRDNFETADVKIWTFTDPKRFLDEVVVLKPDLVFLDYRLPGMNGDMIAERLDPQVPKAMITGDLEVSPKSKFLKIFRKPFKMSDMASFISDFSRRTGPSST